MPSSLEFVKVVLQLQCSYVLPFYIAILQAGLLSHAASN